MPRRAGKRKRPQGRMVIPRSYNPPPIKTTTIFRRKFRMYVSNAALDGTFTEANLLLIPGGICTVLNATLTSFATSVKIHSIEIWGVASADGVASVVCVRPLGVTGAASANLAVNEAVSDNSTNVAYTPYVKYVPRQGSRLSFWLSNDNDGSDKLVHLTAPIKSVLDFDISFNFGLQPDIGAIAYGISVGTVGVQYWPSFTAATGSGTLTPIELGTTQ